ncbi:hypothetical protein V1478_015638 [Vespula squamosa]|uniref:Uncharacterized protein n=1 Tax=Vespula squamosa TaxID=30214 RepID=A0ABD2A1E5_VESSQ
MSGGEWRKKKKKKKLKLVLKLSTSSWPFTGTHRSFYGGPLLPLSYERFSPGDGVVLVLCLLKIKRGKIGKIYLDYTE